MRAAILPALNSPLKIETLDRPVPTEDEVLIKIRAAALNRRDLWIQSGDYAKIVFPAVLGSDISGTVIELGARVNPQWIGRDVLVNPSINWGPEQSCQGPDYRILGMPDQGGLAEYVAVHANRLLYKPDYLDWNSAAALPVAGMTAYRALTHAATVAPGNVVWVTGVGGGVAVFALQFALAMGAKVFVTSGHLSKIEKAKDLGAGGGVLYTNPGWAKELAAISGQPEVVIDGTGGAPFADIVAAARPGGTIVSYGATLGAVPAMMMQKVFWKQLKIVGSTMGSDSDVANMLSFVANHRIKPVVDSAFSLKDVNQAFARLSSREQFGKVIIDMDLQ